MKEEIYSFIKEKIELRKDKHPNHILDIEVYNKFGKEANKYLNELFKEGRIKVGNTINHKFIKI